MAVAGTDSGEVHHPRPGGLLGLTFISLGSIIGSGWMLERWPPPSVWRVQAYVAAQREEEAVEHEQLEASAR